MKRFLPFLMLLFLGYFSNINASLLQADGPLPVAKAFNLDVIAIDAKTVNVRWLLHKDYYLYKDKIAISAEDARITNTLYPDATLKNDEFFLYFATEIWTQKHKIYKS